MAEPGLVGGGTRRGHEQRVDHRVAGDENVACRNALVEQRARCGKGGSEVDVRDRADDAPVDLLRERIEAIRGPQPGLDVANRHPRVEARERRRHRRGGVALDDGEVRAHLGEHFRYPGDGASGQIRKRLTRLHQAEIDLGAQLERADHLVEHLAVLAGDAAHYRESVGFTLERLDDRRQLDRLRPRAEYDQDLPRCPRAHGDTYRPTTERTADETPGPKLAHWRMLSQLSRNQRIVCWSPSSNRVEGS